jgi:enamine deaminase RidA (YjgF/YER057c/UK114 family)
MGFSPPGLRRPILRTLYSGQVHPKPARRVILTLSAVLVCGAAQMSSRGSKQFLNPIGNSRPPGYTQVVTSPPGRMIFISGQGGISPDGEMPKDFSTQVANTFENLARCLKAAGATFDDVVKINYYVADMGGLQELRRIRAKYLNMERPPAATLVQAGLAPGLLVEIEAVAVVPEAGR